MVSCAESVILLGAGWFTQLRLVLPFGQLLIMEPTVCKHLTACIFLCRCKCYNPGVKTVKTCCKELPFLVCLKLRQQQRRRN